jgi:hypothetical protein
MKIAGLRQRQPVPHAELIRKESRILRTGAKSDQSPGIAEERG